MSAARMAPFFSRSSFCSRFNASYIANWLEVLQNDERAIFTAASHAQRAADFLNRLQPAAACHRHLAAAIRVCLSVCADCRREVPRLCLRRRGVIL
jgi:antirestriction protein ArdC